MAQKPSRQLNSIAIKDEVLAHIIPLVRRRCSVIGIKCVWRVQGGMAGIRSAWTHITSKRNECDAVISKTPGVALFFSAISTFQSTKPQTTPIHPSSDEDEGASSNTQGTSTSPMQLPPVPEPIDKCARQRIYPSITYWVAMQSPNGAPVDALVLHSALVECEVEVKATRASAKRGGCEILNKLCQLLKDHKNNFMADLVRASYKCCWSELYEEITGEMLEEGQQSIGCDQVVRMVVLRPNIFPNLATCMRRLKDVGLCFDLHDTENVIDQNNQYEDPPKQLAEPLTVLCNDIERALKKLDYAYREGDVYKKNPLSQTTYFRLCSMDSFLNSLLGNPNFKDRLLANMAKLQGILKHPDCQAISQLDIDRDLVEVNGGWYWSFSQRRFIKQPNHQSRAGLTSPRAFTPYDHDQEVDPQYFQEILTNSLEQHDIVRLCKDFLQLFNCQSREHKQKVPCLIGPSNSGKTSLFMATTKIIDVSKVARVTKQREFNKAMIGEDTELINLDEASVDMMDIDDWKIITQGGWTAHDRKWKAAKGFVNKSPIFITCQKDLDFGSEEDNVAMDNRLNRYHFKTLPQIKKEAAKWIQDHPMNCIVWASQQVGDTVNIESQENSEGGNFDQSGLTSNDKAAIMTLCLDDGFCEQAREDQNHENESMSSADDDSSTNNENPESDLEITRSDDDALALLEKAKQSCGYNTGKARMIDSMIQQAKDHANEIRKAFAELRKQAYKRRQEQLRDIGVDEDVLDMLPTDPSSSIPTPLMQNIEQQQALHKEAVEQAEEQRIVHLFESTWLRNKEKEMANMQVQIENCPPGDVRRAKTYLLETMSEAIKRFHEDNKTPARKGILFRQQMCKDLGILNAGDAEMVKSLYDPLPLIIKSLSQDGTSENVTPSTGQDGTTADHNQSVAEGDKEENEEREGVKKDAQEDDDGDGDDDANENDEEKSSQEEVDSMMAVRKRQATTIMTSNKKPKPSIWDYIFNKN